MLLMKSARSSANVLALVSARVSASSLPPVVPKQSEQHQLSGFSATVAPSRSPQSFVGPWAAAVTPQLPQAASG